MVVALSRGLPVRFKSARVVLVAGEGRGLGDKLNRMGIAQVCWVREMAAAQMLCDAGSVDACLVVLPRALPDDKPDWDAMNAALGTSKAKWDPLTEAGTSARHLTDRNLPKLETMDRAGLLRLAHEAVELTLNKIGVGKSR